MLRPDNMINDEIVEGYLELVRKSGVTVSTTRLLEKVGTHSKRDPIDRGINIEGLRASGPAFIPIHHNESLHWTFVRLVLDQGGGVVIAEHYDSLNIAPLTVLERWLQQHFPGTPTKIIQARSPQQRNSTDCGLFILMGIRMMASGCQHLSQFEADEIMPTFRERVLTEILAGTLNPSSSEYTRFAIEDKTAAQKVLPDSPPVTYRGTGESTGKPICVDTPESSPEVNDEPRLSESESTPRPSLQEVGDVSDQVCESNDLKKQASLISLEPCPIYSELAWVNHASSLNPMAPKERTKPSSFVEGLVQSFAQEQSMLDMLRSAVMAYRTKKAVVNGAVTLASLWNGVACEENPQHTLISRYNRERFSRAFFQELKRLGWSRNRVIPRIRVQMEGKLNCVGEQGTWKAAQFQAARASIWTELVDCTVPFLSLSSPVAICASSHSTTVLESMSLSERETFIHGIQTRLRDPLDSILPNLQAASNLYRAVTENSLQSHTITIERMVDLKLTSFARIVSLAEAPTKLLLPS